MTTEQTYELDLDVEFGGVSYGDATGRIGFRVERSLIDLETADRYFAGQRISGAVTLQGKDDSGQARLPGMEDEVPPTVEAVFDAKGFTANRKRISSGLTFSLNSEGVDGLSRFAKRTGRILVATVSPLDDDGSDPDDDPAHPDVVGGENRPVGFPAVEAAAGVRDDDGAAKPITSLVKRHLKKLAPGTDCGITPAKAKVLADHDIKTIGDLEDLMRSNEWWHRDLKGFGEEWITRLQDAHLVFRQAVPVPAEGDEEDDDGSNAELYDSLQQYYGLGADAAEDGQPLSDNPSPDGTEEHEAWDRGWRETNEYRNAIRAIDGRTVFEQEA